MEKSRAIELLEHLAWDRDIDRNPYGDALNIAIDALKAQLSRENTTSDPIDRQQAIDALCSKCTVDKPETCSTIQKGDNWCEEVHVLQNVPSVQPERPKGEWIPHKSIFGGLGERVYTCNQCGYNIGFHIENFCPHCGVDMRGEQDG